MPEELPEKQRACRPRVRHKIKLPELVKLAGLGLGIPSLAAYFGIAERTLKNYLKDDEEVRTAWEKGSAIGQQTALKSLANAMKNGNVAAIIFYLTNKFPNEWQNTGKGITINNTQQNANGTFGQAVVKDPQAGKMVTDLIARISKKAPDGTNGTD